MAAPYDKNRLRLDSLIEINQLMMSTVEPDDLIKVIMDAAKRLFAAEACSIAVIDEVDKQLVFAFAAGGAEVGNFRIKLGQGVIGWVAQTGEGVIVQDVSKDPRFFSGIDAETGFRTKSLLCSPLRQRGQIIGAIEVLNMADPQGLGKEDLDLLTVFGGLAGTAIDRARLFAATSHANVAFQELVQDRYRFIVGSSKAIQSIVRLARTVAPANTTILILGESGTGKEVLARAIHQWSARADHPFIAVNCVALTPELIESELFGHERGSFTGAVGRKIGKFELAQGGTLFLDEIGELRPKLQTKLLRVLQDKEFQRVGGTKDIRVDVRIIAATNRDIQEAIRSGDFREDLYYRLNVVSITMPPLRERKEDIPGLVHHFIDRYCREVKRSGLDISPEAMNLLASSFWRGNVRELQNSIERAVVLCSAPVLTEADFPAELREGSSAAGPSPAMDLSLPMAEAVDQFKRALVRRSLEKSGGNQAEAARLLGLQRANLSRLMKSLGLR
ncbi:MAG TPA: sigma 54-interacting transcriptional regulator [Acidobacteriota bacterium]|nr:sigma 54-interacting transcriptional regulator [Acidobacteriota bacterium]